MSIITAMMPVSRYLPRSAACRVTWTTFTSISTITSATGPVSSPRGMKHWSRMVARAAAVMPRRNDLHHRVLDILPHRVTERGKGSVYNAAMREISLTQGKIAFVDDEDFERISAFKWSARWNKSTQSYYAVGNKVIGGKFRTILM